MYFPAILQAYKDCYLRKWTRKDIDGQFYKAVGRGRPQQGLTSRTAGPIVGWEGESLFYTWYKCISVNEFIFVENSKFVQISVLKVKFAHLKGKNMAASRSVVMGTTERKLTAGRRKLKYTPTSHNQNSLNFLIKPGKKNQT